MGKGDHREAEKEAFLTGRKVSNVGGVGKAHTLLLQNLDIRREKEGIRKKFFSINTFEFISVKSVLRNSISVQSVCPRLRDSTSGRGGEFTQPRTHFLAISVLCSWRAAYFERILEMDILKVRVQGVSKGIWKQRAKKALSLCEIAEKGK